MCYYFTYCLINNDNEQYFRFVYLPLPNYLSPLTFIGTYLYTPIYPYLFVHLYLNVAAEDPGAGIGLGTILPFLPFYHWNYFYTIKIRIVVTIMTQFTNFSRREMCRAFGLRKYSRVPGVSRRSSRYDFSMAAPSTSAPPNVSFNNAGNTTRFMPTVGSNGNFRDVYHKTPFCQN